MEAGTCHKILGLVEVNSTSVHLFLAQDSPFPSLAMY